MKLNKLTPQEERVILHKDTEAPFSGEYDEFFEEGAYLCLLPVPLYWYPPASPGSDRVLCFCERQDLLFFNNSV